MLKPLKSKTVDDILRRMYARMGMAAAKRAVTKAEFGEFLQAEEAAQAAENYYNLAGARAAYQWS